jgi:hypothetical protein
MSSESVIIVRVGFNQQQRILIDRVKDEGQAGATEGEVVRFGFARWLESEGWRAGGIKGSDR